MDNTLFDILACPSCKGTLQYQPVLNELWCRGEKIAYPIREGIPVMLDEEARPLPLDALKGKA